MKVRIVTITLYVLAICGLSISCASDADTDTNNSIPTSTYLRPANDNEELNYEKVTIDGMDCILVRTTTHGGAKVNSIDCDWDSKEE